MCSLRGRRQMLRFTNRTFWFIRQELKNGEHCVVNSSIRCLLEHVWNAMAHAQKPDLVSQRNGRVHLNRRRESVQSTAGSRGVRISGQTMDRPCSEAQCKSSGYTLQSPISPSLPLPRVTVCHHVSNGLYTSLLSFVRFWRNSTPPLPQLGQGLLIQDISNSHTTTHPRSH